MSSLEVEIFAKEVFDVMWQQHVLRIDVGGPNERHYATFRKGESGHVSASVVVATLRELADRIERDIKSHSDSAVA